VAGLATTILDAEEKADPGRDRELEVLGDRIDDVFADREDRDQQEDHARAEHAGQRLLPGVFVAEHHREGEEGVEPHAGRERDRVIGVERHHQGRSRRRDAGGDEHGALVHPGIAQDVRVDEHDVDHGEEGGQAGDELGAHRGAVLGQREAAFEQRVDAGGFRTIRWFGDLGHDTPCPGALRKVVT
jgi:hypothetical protein